ncbi:MAG: hypothetical protein ABIH52_00385 [Candidatus Aenigmatarchaeota archaeon]|nr:hypothetical protein [Nanoarchaeota archaeon]
MNRRKYNTKTVPASVRIVSEGNGTSRTLKFERDDSGRGNAIRCSADIERVRTTVAKCIDDIVAKRGERSEPHLCLSLVGLIIGRTSQTDLFSDLTSTLRYVQRMSSENDVVFRFCVNTLQTSSSSRWHSLRQLPGFVSVCSRGNSKLKEQKEKKLKK